MILFPIRKNIMDNAFVVVIGSLHHNTLGVIRSLGEGGILPENIVALLVSKERNTNNLISSSKYIKSDNTFFVECFDEIVPWLINHSDHEERWIIICCSDGAANAVISNHDILNNKYIGPSTLMDISYLMVKSNQSKVAEECGLNVPFSAEYVIGQDIDWDIFPCIIKPYKSAMEAGKSDIHIVESKEALFSCLKSIKSEKIQIQQYIKKSMEFQLIGCSLDGGRDLIIPGYTKIIRQPKTTNTGYLKYSPISELDYDNNAVKRFFQRIGYNGLFSIEFVRDKNGKDYFLEINMRNDGNAYCVETAGVNLPYIWVFFQKNGRMPPMPITFSNSIYFIPDFNDLKVAINEIGLLKWFVQFSKAQSHSIYNKKDIMPFIVETMRHCKKLFK